MTKSISKSPLPPNTLWLSTQFGPLLPQDQLQKQEASQRTLPPVTTVHMQKPSAQIAQTYLLPQQASYG